MPKIGRHKTKAKLRNFKLREEIDSFLLQEAGDPKITGKPNRTGKTMTLYVEGALEYFRRLKPEVRDAQMSGIFHRKVEAQPPKHKNQMKFKIFVSMFFVAMSCLAGRAEDDLIAKIHQSDDVVFRSGAMLGARIVEQYPNEITNNAQVADIAVNVFRKFQADPQRAQWTQEKMNCEIIFAVRPPQTNYIWIGLPTATNYVRTNVSFVVNSVTNKVNAAVKPKSEAAK